MRDYTIAADNALRLAWLRVHAERLTVVDPSGLLSAQLRDFADLLEQDNGSASVDEDDGAACAPRCVMSCRRWVGGER